MACILVLLVISLGSSSATIGEGNTKLGCNADGPANRGWVFVDLVKQSLFGPV
jgi:hypothetical protein